MLKICSLVGGGGGGGSSDLTPNIYRDEGLGEDLVVTYALGNNPGLGYLELHLTPTGADRNITFNTTSFTDGYFFYIFNRSATYDLIIEPLDLNQTIYKGMSGVLVYDGNNDDIIG